METIKEFTPSEKTTNRQLYMGGFSILAGIVLLFLTGYSFFIGIGILYIIMGVVNKNRKIIKLHADHLEIKLGPLAPKKLVPYQQITNFSSSKRNLELLYDTQKKIRIPIEFLEKSHIQELDAILQEKTDLDQSNSFLMGS